MLHLPHWVSENDHDGMLDAGQPSNDHRTVPLVNSTLGAIHLTPGVLLICNSTNETKAFTRAGMKRNDG